MGLENYVCDELPWAIRETLRASGQDEVTLLGWCIGGTLCAMYGALEPEGPVRNLVLLTTPIDTDGLAVPQLGRPRLASTSTRSPTRCRPPRRRRSTSPTR